MAHPSPPEPAEYRLGRRLLFAHLALSPLVFTGATLESFEYPKVSLLTLVALLLLGGAAALAARRWGAAGPAADALGAGLREGLGEPVSLGVALFLLSATCSTLLSISARTSFYGAHASYAGLLTVAAYAVLFFATRALCREAGDLRALLLAPALATVVTSVHAVLQMADRDPFRWVRASKWEDVRRVAATLGNPTFLGAFLVMAGPLAACFALRAAREGRRLRAAAWAASTLLAVAAIFATLSRGAWLALVVVVAILGLGWTRHASRRARARALAGGLAALLLVGLGLAAAPAGRSTARGVVERLRLLSDASALKKEPRSHIWGSALLMFRDHPVAGVGLDTFQIAYQRYRSVGLFKLEGHATPEKAHNEALQVLATQGLLGGTAALVLVAGLVLAFVRSLEERPEEGDLAVAVFAGVVGFLVQDVFSFTVAACGALFVTYAAVLSRLGESARPAGAVAETRPAPAARGEGTRAARTVVWAVAALLVYALVVSPFLANVSCHEGFLYLDVHPPRALPKLREAVESDPSKDVYWNHLGMAELLTARGTPDRERRRTLFQEARAAFERAVELVPANAYNHANLGRALGDLCHEEPPMARPQQAYAAFEAAISRDPRNAFLYSEAGELALTFGDRDRTRAWAGKAIESYPRFGPSLWQLGFLALLDAMATANAPGPESTRRFEQAVAMLRDCLDADWFGDASGRAVAASQLGIALSRTGRLEEALAAAQRAVELSPEYADGRYNLARAYERLSQLDRAEAEYRRILSAQPQHAEARAALAELQKRAGAGSPAPPPQARR